MSFKRDPRTVYEALEQIGKIKSKIDRKEALREYVDKVTGVGIFLQFVYHPDYDMAFDDSLKGVLPESQVKLSKHDERGAFLQAIKKFKLLNITSGVSERERQINFVNMCETVSYHDYHLLIGLKDKKLPFRGLQEKFVVWALPELYPPEMHVKDEPTETEE